MSSSSYPLGKNQTGHADPKRRSLVSDGASRGKAARIAMSLWQGQLRLNDGHPWLY